MVLRRQATVLQTLGDRDSFRSVQAPNFPHRAPARPLASNLSIMRAVTDDLVPTSIPYRLVLRVLGSGETILWLVKDGGRQRFLHNQIEAEEATTERYVIDDINPLSARAEYTAHQVIGRGEWETRTESNLTVTCSHESFFLDAKLTAYESDVEIFSRDWNTEIPRDGF